VNFLENFFATFATYAWGPWLLVLLFGGGLFFLFYSRFVPFRYLRHSVQILSGRYDDPNDIGDISHFQALSSALAGTIGMGNISGVAIAIYVGGPGAIFWMWMSALVGTATKFFTCSLAIMYRGQDSMGRYQGGPMYVITRGMGKKWKPLAVFFSVVGLVGCLPAFQANQLTQIFRDVIFIPHGWVGTNHFWFDLIVGLILASLVSLVIFGGIVRIGAVTSKVVPAMVVIYMGAAIWTLITHLSLIPEYFSLIISDAFTGNAVAGGALWIVVITGIRRAAFSNEAGIGTEEMAHGAARTDEPVREGLVAMMGPFIDTIIVCTTTALMILITGVWKAGDVNGVTMTARAFEEAIPGVGDYILFSCVLFFSLSTMFSYSYYGTKCLGFLIGAQRQHYYNYFYVTLIVVAAVVSLTTVINIIDGMYALMAIPTMISSLYLSPSVMKAGREYFRRLKSG
jgi:AGCS family alanine or glycine:cation symporter